MSLTKTDLNNIDRRIKKQIQKALMDFYHKVLLPHFVTKTDQDEMVADLKDYADKKFDYIITVLDSLVKEVKTMNQESQALRHRVYQEHQPKLEDHEHRISSLESAAI